MNRTPALIALAASIVLASAATARATAVSSLVLADGPTAYWRFNDASGSTTAADSMGTSPGTLSGGAALGSSVSPGLPGLDPTTLQLDGTSGYAGFGNGAAVNFTTGLTISTWIQFNDLGSREQAAVWKTNSYGIGLNIPGAGGVGNFAFDVMGASGGQVTTIASSSFVTGTWYNIVATFDGMMQTIYVNGASTATHAYAGAISTSTWNFEVGNYDYSPSGTTWLNGNLSNLALFSNSLSAAQVGALYSAAVAVPEPASLALAGFASVALGWRIGLRRGR